MGNIEALLQLENDKLQKELDVVLTIAETAFRENDRLRAENKRLAQQNVEWLMKNGRLQEQRK